MRKLTLTIALTAALLGKSGFAHQSHEKNFLFTGDRTYSNFCRAITQDNLELLKTSFQRKIGVVALSKSDVYRTLLNENNLSCNGKGLLEFSKDYKAQTVQMWLETRATQIAAR